MLSSLILHWTSPNKEFQLAWILACFDAITDIYTEAEVEALFELVQKFVLYSHLMWGTWSLVLPSKGLEN